MLRPSGVASENNKSRELVSLCGLSRKTALSLRPSFLPSFPSLPFSPLASPLPLCSNEENGRCCSVMVSRTCTVALSPAPKASPKLVILQACVPSPYTTVPTTVATVGSVQERDVTPFNWVQVVVLEGVPSWWSAIMRGSDGDGRVHHSCKHFRM